MRTVNRLAGASAYARAFLIDGAAAHAQTGSAAEIRAVNENANATGTAVRFRVAIVRQQDGHRK